MTENFNPNACTDCLNKASEHIDGELAIDHQSDLFLHLSQCDACREQYNLWMTVREGLRNDRISVSPVMDEEFLSRLSKHQTSSRKSIENRSLSRRGVPSRYGSYALVATIVGVLTLSSTLLLTKFPGNPVASSEAEYSELTKEVLYLMPEVTVYSEPQEDEEEL